ncbi:MAG: rod shape-determining protein MreC [Candidatus Pacebacteria bacterium]|nr:rod shape-determining protein MreC [Candidatus Paceibacterota bacterium]
MLDFYNKNKYLITILFLVLIIILFNLYQKEIKALFYSISSPIQKTFWKIGDSFSGFFESAMTIKEQRINEQRVISENQKLLAEIIALKSLEKENEALRYALGIELKKDYDKLILAQIISKDPSDDYILIDKGSKEGVLKDMPVITKEKIIVGRAEEIYDSFSKIMLISNKKSSFDINIYDKDISGIAKGTGSFNLFIDLLPRDKEVLIDDIVITSSFGGVYPSGLIVGEITKIKKNDIESVQQAEINLAFDIKNIDYLFVIGN